MEPQPQPKAQFPEASVDSFFGKLVNPLLDWWKSADFLQWLWGVVSYIVSRTMALLLGAMSYLAVGLARIVLQAEAKSDPAFQRLAEVGIEDLFGVKVDMSSTRTAGGRGARTPAAAAIGRGVMTGLFGAYTGAQARTIAPSSQPAEQMVTTITQLALEGWLQGWMFEALSLGALEKFADLDDIMSQTLGLGRVARRVMGPIIDILVMEPFRMDLNQRYRPVRLGMSQLMRQYIRGRCTRERLFSEAAMDGYRDDDVEALLATSQRFLPVEQVRYLLDRDLWTSAQAGQHLMDQGYTKEMAELHLTLVREFKVDAYRREAGDKLRAAYARLDIDAAALRRGLGALDLQPLDLSWTIRLAELDRELRSKDLSTGDMEQAVKRGIMGIPDFRAGLLRQGYSLADARTLELLLMTDIATQTEARTAAERLKLEKQREKDRKAEEQRKRREEIAAELAVREVSLGQMETLVRRGIRSLEDYRALLRANKYSPEDVSALAELLEGQLEDARHDAEERERLRAEAARRKLSLGDLERAVKLGLMSVDEYRSQLAAVGFGDEERDLLARILQRELDLAAQAEAAREEARLRLAEQHIVAADVERAVRRGIRTVRNYRDFLIEHGFSIQDADLLARILQVDVDEDAAARSRREEIEARLKRKKISLAEFERAVRAGVRTMADYRALLVREGYSDADAELLARLLQLQVDADLAAAATRKEAEARLAVREISLADLERAVKVGVVDVATYKAALRREGFSTEDQRVLVELLMAELAAVRAAEKKRREAEAAAKRQQISLGDLERAVIAGVRSLAEYRMQVAALGYGLADQETLVELLSLRIAQDQAARRKREEVERALAVRGLSLSQMERAVLEGVKSLAEYRAWLAEQGYSVEDVAVLVALLEIGLYERAERASRQQPGP